MEESSYGFFLHFVAKDGVMYFPPTFSSAFDWLMDRGVYIFIRPHFGVLSTLFSWKVNYSGTRPIYPTWHEAANAAIEKALTLI